MGPVRKKMETPNEWLSVNQAAMALNTTGYTVLTMALKGELQHSLVDNKPVISRASVEAAMDSR